MMVAMLREQGIPARARCGFAAYFNPPRFEDHWACEYWRADERRWILADAQLDEVWRTKLGIGFDNFDVPRGQFLTAPQAWDQCRRGAADPALFGISFAQLYGLWFIAGNLLRDLAALYVVEMLPWDVWGAQPQPDQHLDAEQVAFFDSIAAMTRYPGAAFEKIRSRYQSDERVRVPATVFNALRNRSEQLAR